MDTLNNVASAASKAVFGGSETNKEPVSGVQGDTAKGEPYDAGNLDTDTQDKVEKRLSEDKSAAKDTTADTPVASSDDKTKTDNENDDTTDRPKPHASEVEDSTRVEPTGAGPRPLDTVARENGGDAGAVDRPGEAGKATHTTGDDKASDGGDKDEDKKDDGKTPGQEVVHATGFVAEGGDFDASNPGAGKEADRLTDSKAKGEPSEAATSTSNNDSNDKDSSAKKHGKDKPSLSQRIKNKLHHRKE